ncbi:Protein NipSnap [Schistosoma japonicum]|nr:Protein NipSnap [Schistosoma japonicum]
MHDMNLLLSPVFYADYTNILRATYNYGDCFKFTKRMPGTMIEWGNHWARVMENVAEDNEAVAGLFSHIGDMHVVHHLWTYRDLEARRKARDKVWEDPNWGKCIMHTVPLLRSVTTAILRPTPCSLLR